MIRPRGITSALLITLFLLPACGGGGSGGGGGQNPLTFNLNGISPGIAIGLSGGETVTISGSNFLGIHIARVTFGGAEAGSVTVLDDGSLAVVVPPAPGSATEVVDIEVITSDAGQELLLSAFRYQGPPQPQGSGPNRTGPTALETITITGIDLGLPTDATVEVEFEGLGTVSGTVAAGGTEVTAPVPVPAGSPPRGDIRLTVRNGAGQEGTLAGVFSLDWGSPLAIPIPGQSFTVNGASAPVSLTEGSVVFCTAGNNGTWQDADDDVWLIRGLPDAPALSRILRGAGAVGYLHPAHSRAAVLDADTICLYSSGIDGTPRTIDDRITIIDGIGVPGGIVAVGDFTVPFLVEGPVVAAGSDRVACCSAGGDGLWNANDLLQVIQFTGIAPTGIGSATLGPLDSGAAATPSISVPIPMGTNAMLVRNVGGNGTPADGDDLLFHATNLLTVPMNSSFAAAVNLMGSPVAIDGALALAASAGPDGTVGTSDDSLLAYTLPAGALTLTSHGISAGYNPAAIVPLVPLGTSGAVAAIGGSQLRVFTDAVVGTSSDIAFRGAPLLAAFGSGAAIAYGPGVDLAPGGGDDVAIRIDDAGTPASFSAAPFWGQTLPPTTNGDRVFAVGAGPDGFPNTWDEQLIVHIAPGIEGAGDVATLPLAAAGISFINPIYPVSALGDRYGVLQQPGTGSIIVVRF